MLDKKFKLKCIVLINTYRLKKCIVLINTYRLTQCIVLINTYRLTHVMFSSIPIDWTTPTLTPTNRPNLWWYKILPEMYCSHQYLSIEKCISLVNTYRLTPKKDCHARSNAHKPTKPLAPTIFILDKHFQLKCIVLINTYRLKKCIVLINTYRLTQKKWSHQYLSIDPKKCAPPTLTPTNRPNLWWYKILPEMYCSHQYLSIEEMYCSRPIPIDWQKKSLPRPL